MTRPLPLVACNNHSKNWRQNKLCYVQQEADSTCSRDKPEMISHSLVPQCFKAQQLRDICNHWGKGFGVSHIVFRGNGRGTSRRQQSIKGGLNKVNFIMTTKILPLFLSLSTNRIMILTSCSFFNFKTILFQLLHFPTVYHIDHFCGV